MDYLTIVLTVFCERERYEPKDLFDELKPHIELRGGTLSGDDTVIEKPYSDPNLTEFIGYFWSGNQHRPVKGINLITLYYTESNGKSVPVNYRIYNKPEGKTKNDYFREMIAEVLLWGLQPQMVTGDSWYSSKENLNFLRNQKLGFMMGIAKNRQVAMIPGKYTAVKNLEIPRPRASCSSQKNRASESVSEEVQKRHREILYHVFA
jgi:hypothetical protein